MPTITMTFYLPEEQHEAELARRSTEYYLALYDIVNEARRRVKYAEAGQEMQDFYDWIWRELGDRRIDPFA